MKKANNNKLAKAKRRAARKANPWKAERTIRVIVKEENDELERLKRIKRYAGDVSDDPRFATNFEEVDEKVEMYGKSMVDLSNFDWEKEIKDV